MRAAQHQGQSPAQLEAHVKGLQELGLEPTEQTFNVLLRAHAAAGNLVAAAEVMDRMSAAGVCFMTHSENDMRQHASQ